MNEHMLRHAPPRLSRKSTWLRVSLLVLLVFGLGACDSTGPSPSVDTSVPPPGTPDPEGENPIPGPGPDSVPVPPDSSGPSMPDPDSLPPPPDSTPPPEPPDSTPTPEPPDSTPPPEAPPPVHTGLPLGPAHVPTEHFADFSGTTITPGFPDSLLPELEAARRANLRVFVSFTGGGRHSRDSTGFNIDKWKERIDQFRRIDFTSYIADGTVLGHFLMDEPNDRRNWNGHQVSQADIAEMARYSKEAWPSMVTMIRAWPDYLEGHEYPHLDAIRIQYASRFGPIDAFIEAQVQGAKSLGVAMVGGLNVLNGGSGESGIPGTREGKSAMSADEIRVWGGKFLAEPYTCAFLMYYYDSAYLSRPDIRAAMSELSQKARGLPKKECRT
jgi:hypothetical protein